MNSFELEHSSTFSGNKFCFINAIGTKFSCNIDDEEIRELTEEEIERVDDMKLYVGEGVKIYSKSKTIFVWGINCEKEEIFRRLFAIYSNNKATNVVELIAGFVNFLGIEVKRHMMGAYIHKILNELVSGIELYSRPIKDIKFFNFRFIKTLEIVNPPRDILMEVLNQSFLEGQKVEISRSIKKGDKGVFIYLNNDKRKFYEIVYDIDKIRKWIKEELNKYIEEILKEEENLKKFIGDEEKLKKFILEKKFEDQYKNSYNPLVKLLWKIGKKDEAFMEAIKGKKSFNRFIGLVIVFLILLQLVSTIFAILLQLVSPIFTILNDYYSGLLIRFVFIMFGFLILLKRSGKELIYPISEGLRVTKMDLERYFEYFKYGLKNLIEDKCRELTEKTQEISEEELKRVKDVDTLIEFMLNKYFSSPYIRELKEVRS